MNHLHGKNFCAAIVSCVLLFLSACGGSGSDAPAAPATPPVAAAGSALTVNKNATVTLDGSGSSDPDGHSLTYAWTQAGGAPVVLSSVSSPKPTFTAPSASGALTFSLVVNNGKTASSASSVVITVQNRAPVATVPATLSVATGSQVTLDGTSSSDPDQDSLTYTWTQTTGPSVSLAPSGAGKVSFVAPGSAATLAFSLVVSDGETSSAAATETVTVAIGGMSMPPVASAGPDLTISKRTPISLQATVLHSSGGVLTYQWQQSAGATVTLQGANTLFPSFTTPATAGDLVFSVTITDGALQSAPSSVTVHVINYPPVVASVVLSPMAPRRNDAVSVTASVTDPDNDPLTVTYTWTRNGAAVSGVTGSAYPLGNQVKGDVIGVTVTASDGQTQTAVLASTMIADTPAVLTTTAPTSATYGVPVTFSVTASDADGDATGPVQVDYGPAGFGVDGAGHATWTPNGPMFDRSVDFNWGVRLANTPSIKLSGKITVTDSARVQPLVRSNAGIPVGNSAIEIQDFSGTGVKQVLVGSNRTVYLLEKSGTTYQQSWVYPFDVGQGASISAVASGDVDGDGHREIFIAAGPNVVKLDGLSRREAGRYTIGANNDAATDGPHCAALRFADIDNDGKGELVCLGMDAPYSYPATGRIYVLDAATMQLKWQTADLTLGSSMAVGNVDSDPALEILTSNGYVFDGATQQNQWVYGPGFGTVVDIGNVTGDGIGKIVGLNPGVAARVFDAVAKSPLFDISTSSVSGEGALKVVDLDGTAPAEIIVGDGQWGGVTVYRYNAMTQTASQIAYVAAPGDGVSGIAAGDVDGDGQLELVFGSDIVSSGRDYLTIASWTPTPTVLWSGPLPVQLDGPFYGAKLAQLATSNKKLMFMTPSADSGYAGTRVISMDPATGVIGVSNEVDTNWSRNTGFDVGNVLGNGVDEMLIGTANLYTNYFTAFDFSSNAKVWTSGTTSGGGTALTHADLNGDGVDDLVGLTSDGYVYVYDADHQNLIWTSTGLGAGIDVKVADLDGDGVPEIVVLTSSQTIVYARSGSTYLQRAAYSLGGTSLLIADTNGDGKPEIYVMAGDTYAGNSMLYQFDNTLNPLNSYPLSGGYAVYLEQSAFGRKNLVVTGATNSYSTGTPSTLEVIDPTTGTLIWQSPALLGDVVAHSLAFYDLNGNGTLQLAFGTTSAMYLTQ